eukprot:TRINITY_DN22542_c0_g1_i1.p1 TRINITY_DN22542_c0_g1~~TRINITY_DN22542_c0_g1_i1.p1  ORF type:complete len:565 (+),score=107.22 TRINITY_DN22542_c0_g1_i1:82-1776(+)
MSPMRLVTLATLECAADAPGFGAQEISRVAADVVVVHSPSAPCPERAGSLQRVCAAGATSIYTRRFPGSACGAGSIRVGDLDLLLTLRPDAGAIIVSNKSAATAAKQQAGLPGVGVLFDPPPPLQLQYSDVRLDSAGYSVMRLTAGAPPKATGRGMAVRLLVREAGSEDGGGVAAGEWGWQTRPDGCVTAYQLPCRVDEKDRSACLPPAAISERCAPQYPAWDECGRGRLVFVAPAGPTVKAAWAAVRRRATANPYEQLLTASQYGQAAGVEGAGGGEGRPWGFVECATAVGHDDVLRFKGNAATRHGEAWEDAARDCYAAMFGCDVRDGGFWVPAQDAFASFGVSPDGCVYEGGTHPSRLVEIKCPYYGFWRGGGAAGCCGIPAGYVCQMQGQMAVVNAPACDFVVLHDGVLAVWRVRQGRLFWQELLRRLVWASLWASGWLWYLPPTTFKWDPPLPFPDVPVTPLLPPTCIATGEPVITHAYYAHFAHIHQAVRAAVAAALASAAAAAVPAPLPWQAVRRVLDALHGVWAWLPWGRRSAKRVWDDQVGGGSPPAKRQRLTTA